MTLNGTAVVHTNFLGVIGISQVDISAMSVSTWGNTRLRVALVLDNTGSMASAGKIDALKTASHNLLTQLQQAAVHPEDVYVSVVPFVKDVNVGPENYNQSWLRWDLWDAVNGKCSNTTYHNKTAVSRTARSGRRTPTAPGTAASPTATRTSIPQTPRRSAGGTLYPAEQYSSCPASSVLGLSNDWTALNARIDAMTPAGNTNQAIGLQLGWQTLTAAPSRSPQSIPTTSIRRSSFC